MTLNEKLLELKKSVTGLGKDEFNPHFKFNYVSSTKTLRALRDKMNELGLLLVPAVTKVNTQVSQNKIFTELWMDFTWVNVEDPGDYLVVHWYAQGVDSGERGVGKAYTYGEKYFLLKFFNIPTDKDDPDAEVVEEPKKQEKKASTPRKIAALASKKGTPAEKLVKWVRDRKLDMTEFGKFLVYNELVKSADDWDGISKEVVDYIINHPDRTKQKLKEFREVKDED